MAACWLVAALLSVGARGFDPDPKRSEHRSSQPDCPAYECVAGMRPVQKQEEDFKVWGMGFCHDGFGQKGDSDANPDYKIRNDMKKCCFQKYICAHTCGMTYSKCYDLFWECAEDQCMHYQKEEVFNFNSAKIEYHECVGYAGRNDLYNYFEFRGTMSDNIKQSCPRFNEMQRSACDCVPKSSWESEVHNRTLRLFRKYSPYLMDKDLMKFKNKKFLKEWHGRRPELLFSLYWKYRKRVEGPVEVCKEKWTIRKGKPCPSRGLSKGRGDSIARFAYRESKGKGKGDGMKGVSKRAAEEDDEEMTFEEHAAADAGGGGRGKGKGHPESDWKAKERRAEEDGTDDYEDEDDDPNDDFGPDIEL